jgi:hypothetical protein
MDFDAAREVKAWFDGCVDDCDFVDADHRERASSV